MRDRWSSDGASRLATAARLAHLGGRLAREHWPRAGTPTAEGGSPLFPLDPDGSHGEPIAFLAGDPLAHHESLPG